MSSPSVKCEASKANNNEDDTKIYQEIISSLPNVKGFFNTNLCLYQGGYYRSYSLPGLLRMQDHFKAQSDDIFIASFPKTGTTWLKALVFAIMNRAHYTNDDHPLLNKISHDFVPTLEMDVYGGHGLSLNDILRVPRLLSTHVHYTSLPKSVIDLACKIIYIWRDPKDTFISFWHFLSKIMAQNHAMNGANVALNDNFKKDYDLFCQGLCTNGPYWDHILSYWKASTENPKNVLILKYEDMKREPQLNVKKLANFIGKPFTNQEEENGEIQHTVDLCSFESLSSLQINKTGTFGMLRNDVFYRKGDVGDWKNHLTLDMAERMDEIFKHKLRGYGLTL